MESEIIKLLQYIGKFNKFDPYLIQIYLQNSDVAYASLSCQNSMLLDNFKHVT